MSYAWKAGPPEPNARYVYLALADNANDEGFAFPSIPTIVSKTRLSESTVRRSISSLEADGWLEVKRGKGKGNRSRYTLKMVSQRDLSPGAKGVTVTEKRSQGDGQKVSQRLSKGATLTEPPHPLKGVTVIEPSLNHQGNRSARGARRVPPVSIALNSLNSDTAGEMQAAVSLFDELGVPSDQGMRDLAAQAIRIQAREWGGIQKAAGRILSSAKVAKANGETRWRFWFQDTGYFDKGTDGNGMKGDGNRGHQRTDANNEAARRAMEILTRDCVEENGPNAPSIA